MEAIHRSALVLISSITQLLLSREKVLRLLALIKAAGVVDLAFPS